MEERELPVVRAVKKLYILDLRTYEMYESKERKAFGFCLG